MNNNQSEPTADQHQRGQWATWLVDAAGRDEDRWDGPPAEPHDDGLYLVDLVAAVDYLARGHRDNLSVWDALEEALRWWTTDQELVRHGAPAHDTGHDAHPASIDPLKDTLSQFLAALAEPDARPAADALQQAIRRWNAAMAERHNASHHWPHPIPRRSFPPPIQATGGTWQ